MDTESNDYTGDERRSGYDRRLRVVDQRARVRFNDNGGDRRASLGRRSTDEKLEILE